MGLPRRIVDNDGAIHTAHRPKRPSTTEGIAEAIAAAVVGESVADHVAAADPHVQYQKESEKDQNNGYAGLDAGGLVPEPRISALIARVSQLVGVATTLVQGKTKVDHNSGGDPVALTSAGHGAAADPHAQYRLESASIGTADLANDGVTFDKTQDIATARVLGRQTAGSGNIEELTAAQGRSVLDAAAATQEAESAPALQNSWVDYGGTNKASKYYKDTTGRVHLSGMIKNGTTADTTLLFTLPVGYRPSATEYFAVVSNGVSAGLWVQGDGEVRIWFNAQAANFALSGVSFRAA